MNDNQASPTTPHSNPVPEPAIRPLDGHATGAPMRPKKRKNTTIPQQDGHATDAPVTLGDGHATGVPAVALSDGHATSEPQG